MRPLPSLALALTLSACKPPVTADAGSAASEPPPDLEAPRPEPTAAPTLPPAAATASPGPPAPPTPKLGAQDELAPMIVELSLGEKGGRKQSEKKPKDSVSEPESLAVSTEDKQGQLKPDQVRDVLAKRIDDFRPCVSRDSTVRVEATITTSGAVEKATSDRSDPDDPKMRECVVAVFSKLTFPTDWARAGSKDPTHLSLDLRLKKAD